MYHYALSEKDEHRKDFLEVSIYDTKGTTETEKNCLLKMSPT